MNIDRERDRKKGYGTRKDKHRYRNGQVERDRKRFRVQGKRPEQVQVWTGR